MGIDWTTVPLNLVTVRKKGIVERRDATVELRFPVGKFQKPEDMIGHYVRIESERIEPGEYYAKAVDQRGRVVLEPYRLDRTYAWDDTPPA